MATITEDYVSFETAKLLKEKGFNEPCHATYDTAVTGGKPKFSEYEVLSYFPYGMKNSDDKYSMVISAPTLQMAMKWLRKKYYCHIIIDYTFTADANLSEEYVSYCYNVENAKTYIQYTHNEWYNTYEEACESAIKYCLENLI